MGARKLSKTKMEIIINQLNIVNAYLRGGENRSITVGMTANGIWIIADDDVEIACVTVVRFMLKMKYEFIGAVKLNRVDNNYTLYAK